MYEKIVLIMAFVFFIIFMTAMIFEWKYSKKF